MGQVVLLMTGTFLSTFHYYYHDDVLRLINYDDNIFLIETNYIM